MKKEEIKSRAKKAVSAIVFDLSDRRGMGWDECDSDIRSEIRRDWAKIIEQAFAASED